MSQQRRRLSLVCKETNFKRSKCSDFLTENKVGSQNFLSPNEGREKVMWKNGRKHGNENHEKAVTLFQIFPKAEGRENEL